MHTHINEEIGGRGLKTRELDRARSGIYLTKAKRFQRAAESAHAAGDWDPTVSAAVHAVINALDSLCVKRLGKRAASENHDDLLDLFETIDGVSSRDRDAIAKQTGNLLATKHAAEYEDRLCDEQESARALDCMHRAMDKIESLISVRH
ncbi:MAG: HEPN domain-containing protein [Euryarchaeota archaeon]|nr:HEPN domain-containing protein [Euryarchaeota archaeon]